MKKTLALLLAMLLVCTMLLAGCGSDSGDSNANDKTNANDTNVSAVGKSEVVVGISENLDSLDPWHIGNGGGFCIWPSIYETLFCIDGFGGDLLPVIGKEYEYLSEYDVKVTIYDYVHDSAGNRITASDIKFSYEMCQQGGNWPTTNCITGIDVEDDYTLVFHFNTNKLRTVEDAFGEIKIVSQAAYEASTDGMASYPVSTAGYVVTDFVPSSSVTCEKVEDYWQQDVSLQAPIYKQNVDKIVYQFITDGTQMANAMESGDIDIAQLISADNISTFMNEDGTSAEGFYVEAALSNTHNDVLFNCSENSVFGDNQALRQAVCYAIDKDAVVDLVVNGYGEACNCFGGSIFGDYQDEWDDQNYYDYNVDKAKQLLSQAGYEPGELSVVILTDQMPAHTMMVQIIAEQLRVIGIDSTIESYETALFNTYKADATKWDILVTLNGGSAYNAQMWQWNLDNTYYSYGNAIFCVDEQMQSLLEACLDPATYGSEAINAFSSYLNEQAYAMAIYSPQVFSVAKEGIHNLRVFDNPFPQKIYANACEYAH
ncbi:MAG: ABC transporter substrate-binding protein [Faecousia sp.]